MLHLIYHQDEHKWARIVNPFFGIQGESVHPPFTEIVFHYFGQMFGYINLRWLILIFAIFCFWLIYKIASEQYGKRSAIFSLLLFAIIPYNIIANIQVDIDGAILPFWILLTFFSFTKIDFYNLKNNKQAKKWLAVFIVALLGGFLTKISFTLILLGLFFIFLHKYNLRPNYKLVVKLLLIVIGTILVFGIILWLAHIVYPELSSFRFLEYVTHFSLFNFSKRNYFQVLFLMAKVFFLLSPFLLLLLNIKKNWQRHEFWLWYIVSGLLFYLVLFDFSNRTIDRYMMFLILPLVFIGGNILSSWFDEIKPLSNFAKKSFLVSFTALLVMAFWSILSYNAVLPLVPKIAYIENIKNFNLNFLLPFSSGSGPIGFYMSVKFIAIFFVLSLLAVLFYKFSIGKIKIIMLAGFISIALIYCLVFDFELAYGLAYGLPDKVAHKILTEAVSNRDIADVITYNDTGAYELAFAGKYKARFYTQPIFENSSVGRMKENKGYYTVLDFPEINKQTVFWQYLQSCETIFYSQDKKINGYIFNCQNADIDLLN